MNSTLVKVETKEHRGPLQFTINLDSRAEGDLVSSLHYHNKVGIECFKKQYKDKRKMLIFPSQFFEDALIPSKHAHDVDKRVWQPDFIFCQFFSQRGCAFEVTVNFIEEEEMREKRNETKNSKSVKHIRDRFKEMI